MEKTLQPLTESDRILTKKKIFPADLSSLTTEERAELEQKINRSLNTLTGQELNDYVEKIEGIVPGKTDLRHQQWDLNHTEIARVISNFIKTNNRPPTKNEIAKETGLSRQTVSVHLKEFNQTEYYQEERQKFKMLSHRVLSKVYQHACTGNMKAARLFFEMSGEMKHNTKNFYIQINNIRVDENLIQSLPKDALRQIEQIISQNSKIHGDNDNAR